MAVALRFDDPAHTIDVQRRADALVTGRGFHASFAP
jgi:hypothetical protein